MSLEMVSLILCVGGLGMIVASCILYKEIGSAGLSIGVGPLMLSLAYFLQRPGSSFPQTAAYWLTLPANGLILLGMFIGARDIRARRRASKGK